jgi:hypothetical protein
VFDLTVKYQDGTEIEVRATQREMVAWEMAGYGSSQDAAATKPMAFFWFLAYAALKRLRQLPPNKVKGTVMPFDIWADTVEEIIPPDLDEDGNVIEEAADPTAPDQQQEG